MRIALKIILGVIILLVLLYFLGPRVQGIEVEQSLPEVPQELNALENAIKQKESTVNLKPDNEARIIWANDTVRRKTDYALVYIHGFSSSQEEGDPVHEEFARRYRMNTYLARIADHGIHTDEPFIDLSASEMLESALEALAIGNQLGEKIILMGCSTGGTLALYLASIYPDDIDGIILYSPNVDVYDENAKILTMPWGLQIARLVMGSKYREWSPPSGAEQYWYGKYRLEGAAALKALIDETMLPETFEQIEQPVLMMYYYKNEQEQDFVVSIDRMKEMFDQLATPPNHKRSFAMPETGHHVLTSKFFSKDLEGVMSKTFEFAEEVLQLNPHLDE